MGVEKYVGYDKFINDALVAARGVRVRTNQERIVELERKLETSRLTNEEVAEIRGQLKQLRSH